MLTHFLLLKISDLVSLKLKQIISIKKGTKEDINIIRMIYSIVAIVFIQNKNYTKMLQQLVQLQNISILQICASKLTSEVRDCGFNWRNIGLSLIEKNCGKILNT